MIEQSKIPIANDLSLKSTVKNDQVGDIALMEAIRVLDLLCKISPTKLPKVFPILKKVVNRNSQKEKNSNHIVLAILQFFVNHAEQMVYDPEPVLRNFFTAQLATGYKDHLLAFETLQFCIRNKKALLKKTKVFQSYFPAILKLLAFYPHSFTK